MKFSKKSEYALKALVQLAMDHSKNVPATLISDIAEREEIPQKYLENILLSLKNAGILEAKRGAGGGYYLNRSPKDITLGDILRVIEGPLALSNYSDPAQVSQSGEVSQSLDEIMDEVSDAISGVLDTTFLFDVAERSMDLIEQKNKVLNFVI